MNTNKKVIRPTCNHDGTAEKYTYLFVVLVAFFWSKIYIPMALSTRSYQVRFFVDSKRNQHDHQTEHSELIQDRTNMSLGFGTTVIPGIPPEFYMIGRTPKISSSNHGWPFAGTELGLGR